MSVRVQRRGNPRTWLVGVSMDTVTMGKAQGFLKTLKTGLPYDPVVPFWVHV